VLLACPSLVQACVRNGKLDEGLRMRFGVRGGCGGAWPCPSARLLVKDKQSMLM
jgi:hypothetical protein